MSDTDALDAGLLAVADAIMDKHVAFAWREWPSKRDFRDAILAALRAERVRGEESMRDRAWQPIETAPQNVNVLVAYKNGNGKWRIIKACYHTQLPWSEESYLDFVGQEGEYAPKGWYEESDSHETIYPIDGVISHWMPLPAPPALPTTDKETTHG